MVNNNVINLDTMSLYSGDVITIRSEDGTYLKRFSSLEGRDAIETYLDSPDNYSSFVVEVVGENKIRLKADNGYYLKRFCCWRDMSFISLTKTPDAFSDFLVKNKYKNKITLQAADNEQYFKRYDGDNGRSVITAYQNFEDPYSVFLIDRGGTKCKEIVEKIEFSDITKDMLSIEPTVISEKIFRNGSTSEKLSQDFKVSKTVNTTKTFKWDYNFSLGVETKFEAGIPLVAKNETTVKVNTGFTLGGTQSDSDSQTIEDTFHLSAGPKTILKATAMVKMGKIDVPYTATIVRILTDNVGNETRYTYELKGKYNGTNAINTYLETEEFPIDKFFEQIEIPPKGNN